MIVVASKNTVNQMAETIATCLYGSLVAGSITKIGIDEIREAINARRAALRGRGFGRAEMESLEELTTRKIVEKASYKDGIWVP